jgi:hypothetical protein
MKAHLCLPACRNQHVKEIFILMLTNKQRPKILKYTHVSDDNVFKELLDLV